MKVKVRHEFFTFSPYYLGSIMLFICSVMLLCFNGLNFYSFAVIFCFIFYSLKVFSVIFRVSIIVDEEKIVARYLIKKKETSLFKRIFNPFRIAKGGRYSYSDYCYFLTESLIILEDIKEYYFFKDKGNGKSEDIIIVKKSGKKTRIPISQFRKKDLKLMINDIYNKTGVLPTGSLSSFIN